MPPPFVPPPSTDPDWFTSPSIPSDRTTHALSDPAQIRRQQPTSSPSPEPRSSQCASTASSSLPFANASSAPLVSSDGTRDGSQAREELSHAPLSRADWLEELEDAREERGVVADVDISRPALNQPEDIHPDPQPHRTHYTPSPYPNQPETSPHAKSTSQPNHSSHRSREGTATTRFASTVEVHRDELGSPYGGHQQGFDQSQATFIGEGGPDGGYYGSEGKAGAGGKQAFYGNPPPGDQRAGTALVDEQGGGYTTDGGESDSGLSYRPAFGRSSSTFSEDERTVGGDDVLDDWSDEEDLEKTSQKFNERMGLGKKKKAWGPKRIATALFSTLIGSTFLSGCLISIPLCVHYFWELNDPTEHRRYVSRNIGAWFYFLAFNTSVSWVLAVLVDLVPIVILAIINIIWGEIQEAVKLHVETYNVLKGWIKPILYSASIWGSWAVIFTNIYGLHDRAENVSPAAYTDRLYDVVAFFFFFMLIYCLEKIILQLIALSFHRTAFKLRLDEMQYTISILDKLNLYRPKKSSKDYAHSKKSSSTTNPPGDKGFSFVQPRPGSSRDVVAPPPQAKYSTNPASASLKSPKSWGKMFGRQQNVDGRGRYGGGSGGGNEQNYADESFNSRTHLNGQQPFDPAAPSEEGHGDAPLYPPSMSAARSQQGAPSVAGSRHHPRTQQRPDEEGNVGFEKNAKKFGKGLKKIILHDARNLKGAQKKSKRPGDAEEDEENEDAVPAGLRMAVGSSKAAKALARVIYTSYKQRAKRSYLIPEDFYRAFGSTKEAEKAFRVFDRDGNGDISKSEIKTVIVSTYKERRFLAKSMQDVDHAVGSLDGVLLAIGAIILFFIALSVFGVDLSAQVTTLYTIALGLSFIFKSAASNAFDSIIFLFVTQYPFDSGDRCFIGGENLVVKKLGIFSTNFVRVDGTEAYYYNSILNGMNIINIRRSGDQFENMTVQVGWQTTNEELDRLEKAINGWLATDEHRDLASSTAIMVQHIQFQTQIELTIGIQYVGTWQDWGSRCARRTRFHAAVKHYMTELGIQTERSVQPVRYVDRDDPHASPPFPNSAFPSTPIDSTDASQPAGLRRQATNAAALRRKSRVDPANRPDIEPPLEPMRQALGFLPPADERGAAMTMRKRKARSKKAMMKLSGGDA